MSSVRQSLQVGAHATLGACPVVMPVAASRRGVAQKGMYGRKGKSVVLGAPSSVPVCVHLGVEAGGGGVVV